MAREFGRPQRVADYLRKEISQLIQFQMRDPRVGMVSVTDVEVSRDMSHAKIYVTVLGCDSAESAKEPLKVLNGAAGFLRSKVANDATMRIIPNLRFFFDESVHRGQELSSLIDQAIEHITEFSSGHTESIVTESYSRSRQFIAEVDSSSVMVNASTRFADGFEYGLGAEIGISTDKIHVRGPVGLEGLTSQKFIVFGDGHIRQ